MIPKPLHRFFLNRSHLISLKFTQEWNTLTDEVGRDAQKASYRTSLGLER